MRAGDARVTDTIRRGGPVDLGEAYCQVVSATATALLCASPLTAQGHRVRQRAARERATDLVECPEEAILLDA
jgi:hypothetical protein